MIDEFGVLSDIGEYMQGKLYIVGTPIGNMSDMTYRAVSTLNEVDTIACEDTRHSLILLNRYEIKKPLMSYYMHKERESGERIITLLREGKNVALITDAGMPCVSDPGAVLVSMVRDAGLECTVIPGPTAVASAMALTGITRRGFCFLGFLPEKKKEKIALVTPYCDIDIQLVFYSSPHDINDHIDFLYSVLGDRKVFAVKEITKIFERVECGTLGEFHIEQPRGEFVLIIEGRVAANAKVELSIADHFNANLATGLTKKDAIKLTAKERGVHKDEVYKVAIDL